MNFTISYFFSHSKLIYVGLKLTAFGAETLTLINQMTDQNGCILFIEVNVVRCVIWYQPLFGVYMVVRTHANAFFYLHVVFIRLDELAWHSNGSIKCQTFECHSNW